MKSDGYISRVISGSCLASSAGNIGAAINDALSSSDFITRNEFAGLVDTSKGGIDVQALLNTMFEKTVTKYASQMNDVKIVNDKQAEDIVTQQTSIAQQQTKIHKLEDNIKTLQTMIYILCFLLLSPLIFTIWNILSWIILILTPTPF